MEGINDPTTSGSSDTMAPPTLAVFVQKLKDNEYVETQIAKKNIIIHINLKPYRMLPEYLNHLPFEYHQHKSIQVVTTQERAGFVFLYVCAFGELPPECRLISPSSDNTEDSHQRVRQLRIIDEFFQWLGDFTIRKGSRRRFMMKICHQFARFISADQNFMEHLQLIKRLGRVDAPIHHPLNKVIARQVLHLCTTEHWGFLEEYREQFMAPPEAQSTETKRMMSHFRQAFRDLEELSTFGPGVLTGEIIWRFAAEDWVICHRNGQLIFSEHDPEESPYTLRYL